MHVVMAILAQFGMIVVVRTATIRMPFYVMPPCLFNRLGLLTLRTFIPLFFEFLDSLCFSEKTLGITLAPGDESFADSGLGYEPLDRLSQVDERRYG